MQLIERSSIALILFLVGCGHSKMSNSPVTKENAPKEVYISTKPYRGLDHSAALERIAFGSCADQNKPQPLWTTILANKPDLFLFMGDNIYSSLPHNQPMAEQYRRLDEVPEYRQAREQVPFLATWDDNDYGLRDGGGDFPGKENARRDFLNYWTYVKDSIPPSQQGIYHAKIIGPPKKQLQVILLDTRYYRSPITPRRTSPLMDYIPSEDGTMLGSEQWAWLEEQLKKPANLRFIVTSIQLIPVEPKYEKWGNFPNERQRLFDLLKKLKLKNVIILSGDRHMGSISKIELPDYGPLTEITASSINKPNNFEDQDSHYMGPVYNQENFGLATVDWMKKTVLIELRNSLNATVNKTKFQFH